MNMKLPVRTSFLPLLRRTSQRSIGSISSIHDVQDKWTPTGDPFKSFYYKDLKTIPVEPANALSKPAQGSIAFGAHFSDHMLDVDFNSSTGWSRPVIKPYQNFSLSPAIKALHYGMVLFEGMKAYRGVDGKIRLFRPEMNVVRMRKSAQRSAFPDFDGDQLINIMRELVRLDVNWIPTSASGSLYIRPTMIATDPTLGVSRPDNVKLFVITSPSEAYFKTPKAVNLLADPRYVRSWRGGVGGFKVGSNYAPTVLVSAEAEKKDCQQVLWLNKDDHGVEHVTEAGTMNFFMFWKNEEGENELITARLDTGLILPGITRHSILDLAREWNEFKVSEKDFTMQQVERAVKEGRVYEMFGAGTAAVVSPVDSILYTKENGHEERLVVSTLESKHNVMKRLNDTLLDIQYGRADRPGWTVVI